MIGLQPCEEAGLRLQGKRIVVTGGSRGIGASLVRAYTAAGASVESIARESSHGHQVAEQANASSVGDAAARFSPCDVGDKAQVDDAFQAAVERMGGIDVLAHAAAINITAPARDVTDEAATEMFRINQLGTIHTNQAACRYMAPAGGGAIINFGSEGGISGDQHPGMNSAYGTTKAAVHAWTRHIALEWGPLGIRANAVLPHMWTPMYEQFRATLTPEELVEHDRETRRQVPLGGRFGDPDQDLVPVMLFLASDDSRFITGQMIPVDGGLIYVR